jgi:hypothetical protein
MKNNTASFSLERKNDPFIFDVDSLGVTSLRRQQATASDLMKAVRGQWRIENGLHHSERQEARKGWMETKGGRGGAGEGSNKQPDNRNGIEAGYKQSSSGKKKL